MSFLYDTSMEREREDRRRREGVARKRGRIDGGERAMPLY